MNSFICGHCLEKVSTEGNIGTRQRNHCPFCLYSKHVDIQKGDRKADCQGLMMPIGLTFKKEGEGRVGEIMLVHKCQKCGKLSINRIAGDDDSEEIMDTFEKARELSEDTKQIISAEGIQLATEADEHEIEIQLFGN